MIEIIPAIDLIDGKCVRLTQGDFALKKIYSENPLEMAQRFAAIGVRRLHLVDLDGAKTGRIVNLEILESIARNTDLAIDFGGGVKTIDDVKAVFDAGAKFVSVGSVAVKSPETFAAWISEFGGESVILGADVKNGFLAINGWQTETEIELINFLREWAANGISQTFVTDIGKDGLLEGASVELYREIHAALPKLKLIASGGVAAIDDFAALENAGCAAVIVGKAIYENRITLAEIESYTKNAG